MRNRTVAPQEMGGELQNFFVPAIGPAQAQFKTEARAAGGTVNHPHNLFLQMFYQWGAVGTLLCVATMLRLPARPRPVGAIRRDASSMAAAAMLAGLGASSMLDGPFFYAYPNLVLAIALALACTAPAARIPLVHEDAA